MRSVAGGGVTSTPDSGAGASPGVNGEGAPSTASPTRTTGAKAGSATLTVADRVAGLRSMAIPERGTGRLATVPGDVPAPGKGRTWRVRVQVEQGLNVDPTAYARFVMQTLNDDRSWGHGGAMTFARTDGAADIRVVLASPATSARLCSPLDTGGRLSCRKGDAAVITFYRWVKATPEYRADRTGYRRYVINHEVGHVLGHGHERCPGEGRRAPVMMQQTKGLLGCRANSWPHP